MASRKLIWIACAGVLAAGAGLGLARCGIRPDDRLESVRIRDQTYHLEVAPDFETRQAGLMHRESIPDDGGMLFIFPDVRLRDFWMAYCLIDIDIIYLDAQGRVTATYRMKAHPPREEDETEETYEWRLHEAAQYPSNYPAQFAIELPAGSLDRLNLNVEDKIALDLARLKAAAQ